MTEVAIPREALLAFLLAESRSGGWWANELWQLLVDKYGRDDLDRYANIERDHLEQVEEDLERIQPDYEEQRRGAERLRPYDIHAAEKLINEHARKTAR